jgi:Chaperone of endosialidase
MCSDQQFKQNVLPLTDALAIINQLQPRTFTFDTMQYDFMNFSSKPRYGFVAQEVESILPNVVTEEVEPDIRDTSGNIIHPSFPYKGLEEEELIPFLVSSVQELSAQVNSLQAQLDGCCGLGLRSSGSGNEGVSNQTAELKNSESPFLGQSVPNPHSTQATIPYFIPISSLGDARIIFTDQLGREVNTIDIVGRGQGQLTVMTSQLEDGIYTYSLVVDGKVIDTKKMVKQSH